MTMGRTAFAFMFWGEEIRSTIALCEESMTLKSRLEFKSVLLELNKFGRVTLMLSFGFLIYKMRLANVSCDRMREINKIMYAEHKSRVPAHSRCNSDGCIDNVSTG